MTTDGYLEQLTATMDAFHLTLDRFDTTLHPCICIIIISSLLNSCTAVLDISEIDCSYAPTSKARVLR